MAADINDDRYVVEQDEGWAILKSLDERATGLLFPTQAEATRQARKIMLDAGGGEIVVRALNRGER